jgi:transcriptional regulator with XRE-family HTH domain
MNEHANNELITINELGRLLRNARRERELTMDQVADQTGVTKSTIWRIESEKPCRRETLVQVAQWLNVPLQRIQQGRFCFFPTEPTPQVVDAMIWHDQSLTNEAKTALSEIFAAAYRVLARPSQRGH